MTQTPPDEAPYRYTAATAAQIEQRWQDHWESQGTFHAPNPSGPMADPAARETRDKLYVLDMFPYPSGAGLHVGHPLGYIATDVVGRYHRMNDVNVLHALGYDAFGLPAEQYAVQTGQHPRVTTEANIATMRRQLRRLGLAHDARRSVATTDVPFYRWTQWIFGRIFDAWYDPDALRADGGRGRARPIAELVDELASGTRPIPDGRTWDEMDVREQRELVEIVARHHQVGDTSARCGEVPLALEEAAVHEGLNPVADRDEQRYHGERGDDGGGLALQSGQVHEHQP